MARSAFSLILVGLIWLGTAPVAHAQDRDGEARAFVQSFYDWYAAIKERPVEQALRTRRGAFRDDLYQALEADLRAQAELGVGMSWDPFTATEKPCDRYKAGDTMALDGTWRVNVHGTCRGADQEMPDAIAVVVRENGSWRFANLEYPEDGNLLEILKPSAEGGQ